MANADRTRKLFIRSAVVTAGTAATLFGAQNLALLDGNAFQTTSSDALSGETAQTITFENVTIEQSAPSVTILRHSGKYENHPQPESNQSGGFSIMPPVPSQVTTAQTTLYQQQAPMPQVSKSSR